MPSRRSSSSTSGVAEAAVLSSAPAPPPSAYHSRSSVDRSTGNQPPSSSSSSTTISSAASSSSPAGVSQSQTLPRKFGKLLQLGATSNSSERNRADVDQPATAAVDGSFGLSRIVGLGGRGTTGDGPWRISCSNGASQGKLVLYGQSTLRSLRPASPSLACSRRIQREGRVSSRKGSCVGKMDGPWTVLVPVVALRLDQGRPDAGIIHILAHGLLGVRRE